jgi:hypothetical protein
MPWVGLKPTIPASERAKTFHALDCAATVIGDEEVWGPKNYCGKINTLLKRTMQGTIY